jgi:hypothetical protein
MRACLDDQAASQILHYIAGFARIIKSLDFWHVLPERTLNLLVKA